MLENPIIVFGVASILVMLAFIIGFSLGRGQLQALKLERDRLQAFVDNAGIDFKGLRQIGQELTRSAAAITSASARMVQLADNAEGTTSNAKAEALEAALSNGADQRFHNENIVGSEYKSDTAGIDVEKEMGTGPCLNCSCPKFVGQDYGKRCQRSGCGHGFNDHHYD